MNTCVQINHQYNLIHKLYLSTMNRTYVCILCATIIDRLNTCSKLLESYSINFSVASKFVIFLISLFLWFFKSYSIVLLTLSNFYFSDRLYVCWLKIFQLTYTYIIRLLCVSNMLFKIKLEESLLKMHCVAFVVRLPGQPRGLGLRFKIIYSAF